MSGLQITETVPDLSHMRSQITYNGNNNNTMFEFCPNSTYMLMLFYRSNTNIREIIVIYVLK